MSAKSPAFLRIIEEINELYPGRLTLASEVKEPLRVPTPCFQINRLLGGGLPVNRLNLICGYTGSFKSTLVVRTLHNLLSLCGDCFQAKGICKCKPFNDSTQCAYIDVDQTMDRGYIDRLGADGNRIQLFQPTHGEAACEVAERFAQVPEIRGIVIDTLAMLTPLGNLVDENSKKGYMDSLQRGDRAKLIARVCRALVTHINSPIPRIAILVNHILPLVDGAGGSYLPGGKYQENLSSVILKMWAQGKSKTKQSVDDLLDETVDNTHKEEIGFLIQKSKVSRGNISGEFNLFTKGNKKDNIIAGDCADWESVADWGVKYDLIEKNGKKFRIGEKEFGPQTIARYWRENPAEYVGIQRKIFEYEKSTQGW